MAIYKNANLDISVSAEQNPSYNAKPSVQFSTQDKNTAKYTFTVKQNNKPVDLTGVTASVTLFSEDKSVFQSDATITSATEGKIEYVIPSEAIRHHGKTRGDLRLTYPNGDVLGGLRFSFNIEQALIDKTAGVVGGVYIKDFETLKAEIQKTADSIKDLDVVRIDTKLNELEEQIGEGVGVDEQARQEIEGLTEQLADTSQEAKNASNYYWQSRYTNLINPKTATPDMFYSMIEEKTHPYFSKQDIGLDQSGQYPVKMYKYQPENFEKTIFLVGGIHGDEPYPSYFIARLFQMLIGKVDLPPQLKYIKEKVKVIAIPVANPWGMYQPTKTRWNSRGVNINRNFDWKWPEQPAAEPFSPNYKGDVAFSEVETQYIRDTFKNYKDIAFYIDYHDLVSGGTTLDYVIYADTKTDAVMKDYISFLTKDIENPNGIYSTAQANASSNNYASAVLSIPSVNIEGNPGRYGTVGSTNDVNGNFSLFANGLILMSTHFKSLDRGNFSIRNIIKDYLDNVITLPNATYVDIADSVFSTTPLDDGIITVSGFAMAKQVEANEIFIVRPVLEQPGYITQNLVSGPWHPPYTKGNNPVLPINISIPVVKNKLVNFKLQAMHEGAGLCHFKRFNITITYMSLNNSLRFRIMDGHKYI